MPLEEKQSSSEDRLFWVAITVYGGAFASGLFFVIEWLHLVTAVPCLLIGLLGLLFMIRDRIYSIPMRKYLLITASLMTWVTMALGIGATSAIFSVADAILWKSLPLPDAGRVVMLFERRVEMKSGWIPVSPGNFVDWKQQSRSYERVAAYVILRTNLVLARQKAFRR